VVGHADLKLKQKVQAWWGKNGKRQLGNRKKEPASLGSKKIRCSTQRLRCRDAARERKEVGAVRKCTASKKGSIQKRERRKENSGVSHN